MGSANAAVPDPFGVAAHRDYGATPGPMDNYLANLGGGTADLSLGDPERKFVSMTMASVIANKQPVIIREIVVQAINDAGWEHLVVMPMYFDYDRRYITGVGTSKIRYNANPLLPQPENTAPHLIETSYESVFMQLERKGLGFEIMDDRRDTPEGQDEFYGKLMALINDAALTMRLAAFQGLISAHRPAFAVAEKYGVHGRALRVHDDHCQRFGMLNKVDMPRERLLYAAKEANMNMQASKDFTHVFMDPKLFSHFAFGVPSSYTYSEHGPGNRRLVDGGVQAVKNAFNGLTLVEERPYTLDATNMAPGERLNLLEQRVNIGLYWMSLLENVVEYPQGMGALDIHSHDFDAGDGQTKKQRIQDLVGAAICWDSATGRLRKEYENLATGQNAHNEAARRKIATAPFLGKGQLYDPWLVSSKHGTEIVHMVGNQDPAYLDIESIRIIGNLACKQAQKEWTEEDTKAVEFVVRFCEENRNPDNVLYAERFIASSIGVSNGKRNEFGTYDIPIFDVMVGGNDALYPGKGTFPGFGSMQHLRTIEKWMYGTGHEEWRHGMSVMRPGAGDVFLNTMTNVLRGITALKKLARVMQRLFSVKDAHAANLMFNEDSLPWWNRGQNANDNKLDAMIQNLVLGIHYPAGVRFEIGTRDRLLDAAGTGKAPATGSSTGVDDMAIMTRLEFPGRAASTQYAFVTVQNTPQFHKLCGVVSTPERAAEIRRVVNTIGSGQSKYTEAATVMLASVTSRPWYNNHTELQLLATLMGFYYFTASKKDAPADVTGLVELAIKEVERNASVVDARRVTGDDGRDSAPAKRKRMGLDSGASDADAYTNSYMTLSDEFFQRYFSTDAATTPLLFTLSATDPEAPGLRWLSDMYADTDGSFTDITAKVSMKYARSEFSLDSTCLGKHAASAFSAGHMQSSASNKRARVESGAKLSGAGYGIGMLRTRDPRLRSEDPAPHALPVGDVSNPIVMTANGYFVDRWDNILMYTGDLLRRICEQLLLTQRVHRDAFLNMIDHGIPAPMGIIAVNPYIELSMTHVLFAVAGCGRTYYAFPQLTSEYDAMHKKTTVNLTMWLQGFVDTPEHVFLAENVAFNGYFEGGGHRLVRTIRPKTDENNGFRPVDRKQTEYDFDPSRPELRRADRFALHVGASTKNADVPDPLPLLGAYDGEGAYRGDGSRIKGRFEPRKGGPLFDSALLTQIVANLGNINRPGFMAGLTNEKEIAYARRNNDIRRARNTVCYRGNQYLADPTNGAITICMQTGTGLLGDVPENAVPVLNGMGLMSTLRAAAR